MSTLGGSTTFHNTGTFGSGLKRFGSEVLAFLDAIASPGKIIGEVEKMRALQVEAGRIEATEPARAADLRRQASLLCRR